MADFIFSGGKQTKATKAAKSAAISQQRQSDFQFDSGLEGDKNWNPSKIGQEVTKQEEQVKLQKEQQKKNTPANQFLTGITNAVGNFTAGVNEKVLGGAARTATKAFNMATSGFNNEASNKKTESFLKQTKQINEKGEAPLASGNGINRGSTAFQTGSASGDTIKGLVGVDSPEQAYNALNQARISALSSNKGANPLAVKNQIEYLGGELKKGKITQDYFNKEKARLESKAGTQTKAIKEAEKVTGTTYAPNAGALDLLMTAANLEGLGAVGKAVFNSAAKAASKRLGRDLTEEEAKNLAAKTKNTVPEKGPQTAPNRQAEVGSIPGATIEKPTINVAPTIEAPLPKSTESQLPSVNPTIEAPKPVKSFAPLDEPTVAKVSELKTRADTTPVPEGHTRLYQTKDATDANIVSDQYFKSADEVGNFINGRADNAELRFIDVPNEQVKSVPGKPTVFKVEQTPPIGDTISGNAARIEARGLEKKLTENMGDLPEYKSINMKEQAQEATDLITNNRQHAIDVIEGKANPPGNLKAQSIHQALEELAIKEGDGELLTKLAKSHVNTELSGSAQNLRIAAERDPNSAVEQIRQIRDARIKAAERRSKTTVKKEAKDITKKVDAATPKATKQDWASFVKELTC